MKTLSIKQPWASLIAEGIKDIENRTWKTNFRGRIYIHASSQYDPRHREMSLLFTKNQYESLSRDVKQKSISGTYIKSAIIGEVDIIDCVINHESIWAEKSDNYCRTNPKGIPANIGRKQNNPIYNWVLANAKLYPKPILNVKGKLSLWEFNNL